MDRIKVFIYFIFFLIANSAIAQVDTVTFRFEPDVATFKIRCIAQKIIGTDTSDFNFNTSVLDTNYTFTWGGDGVISENGIPRVTYSFTAAGNYSFTLDVEHKPTSKLYEETKTFDILDIIRVPNVFTPNGDGENDLFVVNSNGIIPLDISIYSRTGTLVYSARAPIIVWDGRNSSGSELSEGVYFYILKSDDPAVLDQNGFLHLYR